MTFSDAIGRVSQALGGINGMRNMQREIGGSTGSNAVQRLTRLVVCASIFNCAFHCVRRKEPNNVGVSGVVYNYSDVDLAWVKIKQGRWYRSER